MILITGASGYIGGQLSLKLRDLGYKVAGLDRRPPSVEIYQRLNNFFLGDFGSETGLKFIKDLAPSAVIHCAGTSLVGPSMKDPAEYFSNNFVKTLSLLNVIKDLPARFIFSSTAAIYGIPNYVPCNEYGEKKPISPYGESKLMIELALGSYAQAYGLDYVAFRYFNACGADPQGRHGPEPGDTHIIPRILESMLAGTEFVCNGNNYDTPDGTCIRDYIHIEDLADAHILALDKSLPGGIYNLGSARGYSNLEIINMAKTIAGQDLNLKFGPTRLGDPGALVADFIKFRTHSGWTPKFGLEDIIQHTWNWYTKETR